MMPKPDRGEISRVNSIVPSIDNSIFNSIVILSEAKNLSLCARYSAAV